MLYSSVYIKYLTPCDYFSCLALHTVMYILTVGQIMRALESQGPAGMQAVLAGFYGFHDVEDTPQFCSASLLTQCYSRV